MKGSWLKGGRYRALKFVTGEHQDAEYRLSSSRRRHLCWQLMRTIMVLQMDLLLALVFAWVLCAPTNLAGTTSLGELTPASAAFIALQTVVNWTGGPRPIALRLSVAPRPGRDQSQGDRRVARVPSARL